MFSALLWVGVGIVVKTLVPMPVIDVAIHNGWASLLGAAKLYKLSAATAAAIGATTTTSKTV